MLHRIWWEEKEGSMKSIDISDGSERTMVLLGGIWWPQTAINMTGLMCVKVFLTMSERSETSAEIFELSPIVVETVLRLERIRGQRSNEQRKEQVSTSPPPHRLWG